MALLERGSVKIREMSRGIWKVFFFYQITEIRGGRRHYINFCVLASVGLGKLDSCPFEKDFYWDSESDWVVTTVALSLYKKRSK